MEATIRVDQSVATLINVFTVKSADKQEFLALLQECTETRFSQMPGWISASLLESNDGTHIIAYSQWENAGAIDGFRQDPAMKPYFERFQALAEQQAFACNVVYSLHA